MIKRLVCVVKALPCLLWSTWLFKHELREALNNNVREKEKAR